MTTQRRTPTGTISIGIWDDSYYVDVGPMRGETPITLTGDGAERCSAALTDDPAHPIYYGGVIPKVVRLTCR